MLNSKLLPCILMLGVLAGCAAKSEMPEETAKYKITSPLVVDTSFTKEYVAQIQSVKNIEIRAQEKGYLQAINVDEGQHVKAGQVLFRIMPQMYQAEMLKAQAGVKEAELELMNSTTLADKNIVSKTEQSINQAKLDEAKADLALAKLHLSLTEIRAPFDGTIDRIPLKLGSLIDEGALLTTLSDNKNVYAYFNVPENEYLDYTQRNSSPESKSVSLLLANNTVHKYPGRIETVESEFDNATGNIAFRAKFPNPDQLLRHGETGKVRMTVPITNAVLVPQKATYEIQDRTYVYVVDDKNVIRSKEITVSNTMPDLFVVSSGLSAKDRILLDGVQSVKDDQEIKASYVAPRDVVASLQLIH